MPELPDIALYIDALEARIAGRRLKKIALKSPFLLRSVSPPIREAEGRRVSDLRRLGKRICIGLEGDLWLVLHLMIAGRLHWAEDAPKSFGKREMAVLVFENGHLTLTEAGSKKRASLYLVDGEAGLAAHDPGGLDVLDADRAAFAERLTSANHTLKRALTDPRLFSGIGNAYSDEILHAAGLSPVAMTGKLTDEEIVRLHDATIKTLKHWIAELAARAGEGWPKKVTAFQDGMAVHGRYGEACPVCGTKVQRIRHAANETNYCPRCQTGGKVLADRSLSRLLGRDWPKSIEELEERALAGRRER